MSGLDIPDTVNAADVTSWSDEADVVVIGFGIAGGCAAVSAAAAGATSWCWRRRPRPAAPASMAGGHFYLGGGTAVQQATGHEDSAEEMYKYLVAVSRDPDLDKIRAYCDGSVEHFNWLEALGFQFERSYYQGKVVVPPGTEGLSYTGNEKVWPFCEKAETRAARAFGAGARGVGRRRHGDRPATQASRPTWACRSATRPGRPIWSSTTAAWSESAGSTSPRPARSRPRRSSSPRADSR